MHTRRTKCDHKSSPCDRYKIKGKLEQCFQRKTYVPLTSLNRHIVEIGCIYNFSIMCVCVVDEVRGCSNNFSIFWGFSLSLNASFQRK